MAWISTTRYLHGWCNSWEELFNRYLDTDEFHKRVENKPPVSECVEFVKNAGGVTSLAHPWQLRLDNDALDALVRQLKDMGLDAIECYYPKHTPEQTAFYLLLEGRYARICAVRESGDGKARHRAGNGWKLCGKLLRLRGRCQRDPDNPAQRERRRDI